MSRLEGCCALVTGGLRGIGWAIAERFIAEGASVVLADLLEPKAAAESVRTLGTKAGYLRLDVGEEDHWVAAVGALEARFGGLDVLVANAGIDGAAAVTDMSLADWRRVQRVNLDGVFLATRACADLLSRRGSRRRGGSSIVNMSSMLGMVGYAGASAYAASKGGVRLLTKSTALEFAQAGTPIRVNSLHPGFVDTPLLREGMDRAAGGDGRPLMQALAAATPVGRLADAAEIAAAALFLACEDSSFITGTELVVDGGYTAQ